MGALEIILTSKVILYCTRKAMKYILTRIYY